MSVHNRREPAWHRQVISALGKWKARNSLALSATLMRNLNRRMTPVHLQRLTASALGYTERLRVPGVPYGRYLYRERGVPVLYASVFAALLRHLAGDLESLTEQERSEWVSYVNSFQSADGLYRDPAVQSAQAETEDWWGWRHLTLLVLMALHALQATPRLRLFWLDDYSSCDRLLSWLENLDWASRVDFTGNVVLNRVAAMQFARDFMGEHRYSKAIELVLDYLSTRCDPESGLWGEPASDAAVLSRNVQAAYHFWLLFAYDGYRIPHGAKALPLVLSTQSASGGFSPLRDRASACEDIDSIDPLTRMDVQLAGRDPHVAQALGRGARWVAANFQRDGGAVFRIGEDFEYGHRHMATTRSQSSIFATWFRLLALALIEGRRAEPPATGQRWTFLDAPGYQIGPLRLLPGRRFSRLAQINTGLTELEKWFLFNAAAQLQAGAVAVEVGSYVGASSCYLAEGLMKNGGQLYCVDTWRNDAMSEGSRDTFDEFRANSADYRGSVLPLRGDSADVAQSFELAIDLLFVDGDHSYDAVRNDLAAWLPKVRPGGLVIMHDSGWAEGVQRVIREVLDPICLGKAETLPNTYAARIVSAGRSIDGGSRWGQPRSA